MEFSLLHAGIAAGAAMAAIPVIIHLFQRQTPKKVIFPALRLLREKSRKTTKRLRIKNWLLLLARMALIALMALALARPTWNTSAPLGDAEVPTAMALIFDTSLSMEYQDRGQDRLAAAKEQAAAILKRTPDSSQVFVIDAAEPGAPPPLSPASAAKRIDGIKLRSVARPLNDAVSRAYAAVAESDRPRREVFVLTDLARSSWEVGRESTPVDRELQETKEITTFVLRLNPEEVRNVAVVAAAPSGIVTENAPAPITIRLRNDGPARKQAVHLMLDGKLRDQKEIDLPENGEIEFALTAPKLLLGLHQGEALLADSTDAMTFDDRRGFSFSVAPPLRVLVVSDLRRDAEFLAQALEPERLLPTDPRPYRVDRRLTSQGELPDLEQLSAYAAVFVNNVTGLSDEEWGRLSAYVRRGGGVILGIGDRARPDRYNTERAQSVLPAKLEKPGPAPAGATFGKPDGGHPLFNQYTGELTADLNDIPVMKRWQVTPNAAVATLLGYSDEAPALLERVIPGTTAGHVLLWTTPLARRPSPDDPAAWNEFPMTSHWAFFYLMDRTIPYVTGTAAETLNFQAGEDPVLRIPPGLRGASFLVQGPAGTPPDRVNAPENGTLLPIIGPRDLGAWSVTPAGGPAAEQATRLGFTINPPARESQLVPLKAEELEQMLGKERVALATDSESLERVTSERRVGRELFPWMMLVLLALVTAEHWLANNFYRQPAESDAAGRRAVAA